MNKEDGITVTVRDWRGENNETYQTEMPVEQFYRLLGCENSQEFFDRFAPAVKKKFDQKADMMGSKVESLAGKMGAVNSAVCEAHNRYFDLLNESHRVQTIIEEAEKAIKRMEEVIERYEATRRQPGAEAHSISPDGETWVCDKCGTVLGRMSLYGLDGKNWRKTPRFCPGCGAANVDGVEQDKVKEEPGEIYQSPRRTRRRK